MGLGGGGGGGVHQVSRRLIGAGKKRKKAGTLVVKMVGSVNYFTLHS